MSAPLFIATAKFDSADGQRWRDYVTWAKIPNLLELVSLARPPADDHFVFLGYDLIEEATGVSALTNCGGFPETFSNDELSQHGLIMSFARAREIRKLLPINNFDEPHAECEMYAIWRVEP